VYKIPKKKSFFNKNFNKNTCDFLGTPYIQNIQRGDYMQYSCSSVIPENSRCSCEKKTLEIELICSYIIFSLMENLIFQEYFHNSWFFLLLSLLEILYELHINIIKKISLLEKKYLFAKMACQLLLHTNII